MSDYKEIKQMTVRINDVIPESIVDGFGFRYVIFAQGCKHNCKECFNPHTHNFNAGSNVSLEMILEDIREYLDILDGVTFSGGDPFEQAPVFAELAKEIKKLGLNVWSYSGYTFEQILECPTKKLLLEEIDVLVDGKFDVTKKDLKLSFRGSANQRVIDVKESLKENKIILINVDKKDLI